MLISNNCNVGNSLNQNNYTPNFKGTYVVQIPHKAFSNPEDIAKCNQLVGSQISKFMRENKFLQKLNNFLNYFNLNFLSYPEKFSYIFSKNAMKHSNLNYSMQWLRANTGLPIADAMRENYHSFFIYTKKDTRKVLKQFRSILKERNYTDMYKKYTDPQMGRLAANAKLGVTLDSHLEDQYRSAVVYEIENLSELKEVAQKIKQADM